MNKGIYYASFTALLWGFLAIAIKMSLNDLPPLTVSWVRFVIAFLMLSGYYLHVDRNNFSILKRMPRFGLFAGICLGLNYLGFISGIHYTSPSIGQIFIQTGPVLLAEDATPTQGISLRAGGEEHTGCRGSGRFTVPSHPHPHPHTSRSGHSSTRTATGSRRSSRW